MQISKKISAMILSFVLVIASFGTANAAKRLTAAVADWTCLLYTSPSPRD